MKIFNQGHPALVRRGALTGRAGAWVGKRWTCSKLLCVGGAESLAVHVAGGLGKHSAINVARVLLQVSAVSGPLSDTLSPLPLEHSPTPSRRCLWPALRYPPAIASGPPCNVLSIDWGAAGSR
eukprot:360527-Chlamydomonas_euryale.AAC.1